MNGGLVQISKRLKAAAVALPVVAGALFLGSPQASAYQAHDCLSDITHCLVLTYNSNDSGAAAWFESQDVSNLAGYYFDNSSFPVKNDAASGDNVSTASYVSIYYNSNYGGICDSVPPSTIILPRLVNTYNEDASFAFWHDSKCYQF